MASYLLPIQCAVHLHPSIGIQAEVFRPFFGINYHCKKSIANFEFFSIRALTSNIQLHPWIAHGWYNEYSFATNCILVWNLYKANELKNWIEIFAVWEFYWFTQRWISNCTNQVITELRLVCRTLKHKIMSAKLSLSITFITIELMRMQFVNADVRVYCE